ncbi:hypothetical protein, partial [Ramlibacter sp.]|uniref:hypothetical protein n=1 Tax=Ramlibacter sp. TaxID=1917967 RepID=UPI0026267EFF
MIPGVLRDISGAHQELEVGERNLRVLDAADDKHRRRGLLKQTQRLQRHRRADALEILDRLDTLVDAEEGRDQIEQVLA